MKKMLSLALAALLLFGLWVIPASAATYATVRGGWLRLRAEPSYQAYVITSYPTGTQVTVLQQLSGWCQVLTPDQRLGYMDSHYLTISGSTPGYVAPTYPVYPVSGDWVNVNRTGYVTSANGKGVRLRRTPNVDAYNVLGLYPVGRRVTVLKTSSTGWSYIRIGTQEGYMMSQFITYSGSIVTPVPTRQPYYRYTAYLTTDNGRDIYLRRDASMNFRYIAVYPVGTQVTVLGTENGWTHVIVDGLEGYVQSVYVTTTRPGSVPSYTEPPYPWYPDPTEAPYVDPGTGGGTKKGGDITSVRLTINKPRVGETVYVVVAPVSAEFTAVWYRDDNVLLTTGNSYTVRSPDRGHVIYVRVTGVGASAGTVVEAMTGTIPSGPAVTPTPVPDGVVVPEWIPELAEIHTSSGETAAPAETPVAEWVDPAPVDSWSTGDGEMVSEWVD